MNDLVLGDSLEVLIDHRGKTPKKLGADFTDTGVPVVSAILVNGGSLDLARARYVSPEIAAKWMPIATRRGDVLLTSEAPLGRVARVPSDDPLVLGQRLFGLRGKRGVLDTGFLYYALQSPMVQSRLGGRATGTTVVGIRQASLRELRISAPSFPQQVAIAEVLSALDDKIAANRKLAATSDGLAEAEFLRATMESSVEHSLSDVTELIVRGGAPKYVDAGEGMVVINQKCIRHKRVDIGPARWTSSIRVRDDRTLRVNDVLVNSTGVGTLGRVSRWTDKIDATVDSHVTILRFRREIVDPVCAGFAVLHAQNAIEMMGEGSTGQTELSRDQLGKLRLRFVSRSLESALSGRLSSLAEISSSSLAECSSLGALRDTLLPRLMSGELRVRDAEKVVENVL